MQLPVYICSIFTDFKSLFYWLVHVSQLHRLPFGISARCQTYSPGGKKEMWHYLWRFSFDVFSTENNLFSSQIYLYLIAMFY